MNVNQSIWNVAEHQFKSCDLMSKFTPQFCVADQRAAGLPIAWLIIALMFVWNMQQAP